MNVDMSAQLGGTFRYISPSNNRFEVDITERSTLANGEQPRGYEVVFNTIDLGVLALQLLNKERIGSIMRFSVTSDEMTHFNTHVLNKNIPWTVNGENGDVTIPGTWENIPSQNIVGAGKKTKRRRKSRRLRSARFTRSNRKLRRLMFRLSP